MSTETVEGSQQTAKAKALLSRYLDKTLRVHTNDSRIFTGQLKCTDRDCNLILFQTYEYRKPPSTPVEAALKQYGIDLPAQQKLQERYIGMVVVPGKYITKVEMEEPLNRGVPGLSFNA